MDPIKQAVKVFAAFAADHENRLARGAQLRQQMHEALKAGKLPTGYRAEFVRDSALAVIQQLGEMAKGFDSKHLDDRCSGSDLMDILATAAGLLKKHNG